MDAGRESLVRVVYEEDVVKCLLKHNDYTKSVYISRLEVLTSKTNVIKETFKMMVRDFERVDPTIKHDEDWIVVRDYILKGLYEERV